MRMLLLVAVAVLTTGCSTVMYPGYPGGHRPSLVSRRAGYAADSAPVGRWDNVMRLAPGSTIDVLTRNGMAHVGGFAVADETHVWLKVAGAERPVARLEIVRVDLVGLPGSTTVAVAKRAGLGALIGTAGAAVIAGVIGGQAWPPPGPLLRGGAAGGAWAGGEAELAERYPRAIYLAPSLGRP